MKTCKKCLNKFEYIDFINHRCYTVQEWKVLSKTNNSAASLGNDLQFFNFFTQKKESYDSITTAEIILSRNTVLIANHINKRKVGKMVKVPLKEKLKQGLKNLPSKLTQENFDKGMATFDKGMDDFNKEMKNLSKGLGGDGKKPNLYSKSSGKNNVEKLIGKQKKEKRYTKKKTKKDDSIMDSIWGKKKSSKSSGIKIWNDPPKKKRKTKRKSSSKSNIWDGHEKDMEKIWGKKR